MITKHRHLMAQTLIAFIAIGSQVARSETPPKMYVIASWGDIALVYGPGTDPAMDSVEAMTNVFTHWKARGFTGIYLRTDLAQVPPGSIVRSPPKVQSNSMLALCWRIIDAIMAKSDPHTAAGKAAAITGFEYWMYHPYIYSEGAPPNVGIDGPGRMVPWSYARKYHIEHPEVITIDRAGNQQWMVPEYAYPGARAEKVAEFVYLANTYKPTGIIASMRSEASQLLPPPDNADQYGFNKPIVDEMKRLYGVDISTDPRFDYKSPSFKSDDPILDKWRDLRGAYLTQLYREVRAGMKAVDPAIQFGVTLSGDHIGPVLGNWRLEWKKWVDEGIVDVLVLPISFEATYDADAGKKGYLTNVRAGVGTLTVTEVKAYISQSKHPEIKVIQSGAPSYFYPPPPQGADGWQCDIWYDAYTLAIYQRWEQWKKDLKDFGCIKFLDQNFDDLPVSSTKTQAGEGDFRYEPALRSCPGAWHNLGDGTGNTSVIQSEIRRGDKGNALLLKATDVLGQHFSSPDRGRYTSMLDTAIANGKAHCELWAYRDTPQSSFTMRLTGDIAYESDVAIRVQPGSGAIEYASGSQWIKTDVQLPLKQWTKLGIDVDLDAMTYAGSCGEDNKAFCGEVKFAPAKERFVVLLGVNIPIKVPSYRVFNVLYLIAGQERESRVGIDDVKLKWVPTMHYVDPGKETLFSENFENEDVGKIESNAPSSTRKWNVTAGGPQSFVIEDKTSYGVGAKCLRCGGGGVFTANLRSQPSASGKLTVDLDVFLRSDQGFPYIIPDPKTKSSNSAIISLGAATIDRPAMAANSAQGLWQIWDGTKYVNTGKIVTYDVWTHLQLAFDSKSKSYQFVSQPIGELPTLVGTAPCSDATLNGALSLKITPVGMNQHLSCFDNIVVTSD